MNSVLSAGVSHRRTSTRGLDAASLDTAATAPLGVSVADAAPATTVNPVQTTTYHLKPTNNPITFGTGTSIKVTGAGQEAVNGASGATYAVTNEGVLSSAASFGIYLGGAGSVTNSGTISGYKAVDFAASGKLINTGVLNGGVQMENGGSLNNETSGRILGVGHVGVTALGAPLTLSNAGYIYGGHAGIGVQGGGKITNAASGNINGGEIGIDVYQSTHATVLTNAGQISASPAPVNYGVEFDSNNGAVDNLKVGEIDGVNGMQIKGVGVTVTNAGSILGASNTGSAIIAADDTIVNQKGGLILGGISGVILDGGRVANAGSIVGGYNYGVFLKSSGTVLNEAGGVITGGLYGALLNGVSASLTNAGSIVGKSRAGAVFSSSGKVANWAPGTITGTSGVVILGPSTNSAVNAGHITGTSGYGVKFSNGGLLNNEVGGVITSHTQAVLVSRAAGTVTNAGTLSGVDAVDFTGSGANALFLQSGSNLAGAALGSTASGATNALILQGTGAAANWFQNFTTLNKQGTGTWTLSGESGFGSIRVSAGELVVTGILYGNVLILKGATLQVGEAGQAGAELGAGGAFTDNGVLQVNAGLADVYGAVGGEGSAVIAGGTLEFDSTFTQNVAFTGASGVLQLAKSQSYTGSITGLSLTGGTSLDLRDIGFTSGTTKVTYADNGSHTGGVLTVTDGTHTAHIKLVGNFSGSTFNTSSDSHGGTTVVDRQTKPAVLPFIAAMASFGADGGYLAPTTDPGRSSQPLLTLARSGRWD